MLWIEGNVAGTVSERNHGTLVQGPLSKSFKQEFMKKSIVSFYEC